MAIGIPYQTFWHLNPKKLEYFYKAEIEKKKTKDWESWMLGLYVYYAIGPYINKKNNYPQKPILQDLKYDKNKELTEEEKKKETEKLFMQLQILAANHKLNKDNN